MNYNVHHHSWLRELATSYITRITANKKCGKGYAAISNFVLMLFKKLENNDILPLFLSAQENHERMTDMISKITDSASRGKPLTDNEFTDQSEHRYVEKEKILDLYRSLQERRGVVMLGPSCSGKSSCLNELSKLLSKRNMNDPLLSTSADPKALYENPVVLKGHQPLSFLHMKSNREYPLKYHYFPGALSLNYLYGNGEEITDNGYQNGLVRLHLQKIFENSYLKSRQYHEVWLIFDGRVDSAVLEVLTPLLNESWEYTTLEGTVIKMKPSLLPKIVLETLSVETLSPATLVDLAIINFSHDESIGNKLKFHET